MSDESVYPSNLPGPEKSSWQVKDRARSAGQPGKAYYAAPERDFSGTVELEFFLSSTDAELWYSWWLNVLDQGGIWFVALWPKVAASLGVYKFSSPPVFTHVYNGAYRVSVTAACRGKSTAVYLSGLDPYYNAPVQDPYKGYVALHMRMEGAEGAVTTTDSSSLQNPVTRGGLAAITRTTQKFGEASSLFPSSDSRWDFAASLAFVVNSSDFTVEAWVRRDASLINSRIFQVAGGPQMGFYTAADTFGASFNATEIFSIPNFIAGAGLLGTWVHIVFEKRGTAFTVYRNGVNTASATSAATGVATASVATVGNRNAADQPWNGWIAELRYTVGIARYENTFLLPEAEYPVAITAPNNDPVLFNPGNNTGVTLSNPLPTTYRAVATTAAGSSYYTSWMNTDDLTGLKYIEFVDEGAGDSGNGTGRGVYFGLTIAVGTPPQSLNATNVPMCMVFNYNYNGGSPGYSLGAGTVVNGAYDFVRNDVVSMAVNTATCQVWVRKNGAAWIGGGDPVAGTAPTFTYPRGMVRPAMGAYIRGAGFTGDYRVRAIVNNAPFVYTPPAGFTAYRGYWTDRRTVASFHGETVVDSSTKPKPYTNTGAVAVSEAQFKYGRFSLLFNGSTQYLFTRTTDDLSFGSGPYVIEAWVRPTALASVLRPIATLTEQVTTGFGNLYLALTASGAVQASVRAVTNGAIVAIDTGAVVAPLNAWTHVVLCRNNVNTYIFVNGQFAAGSSVWVDFPNIKTLYAGIGGMGNGHTDGSIGRFQGYIDDLRMTRNATRYLQLFAPPTAPFPDSTVGDASYGSVVLHLKFNGENNSTLVPDSSTYNRAYIVSGSVPGSVRISTTDAKFGGSSLAMDNQTFGAWSLSWAQSSDFDLNTGDFTIEMWAKELSGFGSAQSLICRRLGGSATGWAFTTNSLRAKINGVWSDGALLWPVPSQDVWHHYALVRKGGLLMAFVDGELKAAKHGVTTIDDLPTIRVYLGQGDNASENKFYGFIDELRWTKGVARYSANFTPHSKTHPDRGPAV